MGAAMMGFLMGERHRSQRERPRADLDSDPVRTALAVLAEVKAHSQVRSHRMNVDEWHVLKIISGPVIPAQTKRLGQGREGHTTCGRARPERAPHFSPGREERVEPQCSPVLSAPCFPLDGPL